MTHSNPITKNIFIGAHTNEIISITNHPLGQLFATSEYNKYPVINIWNSIDMNVISRINCNHLNGVPLLAFNTKVGNNFAVCLILISNLIVF